MENTCSRRNFIKASGLAVGGLMIMGCGKTSTENKDIPIGLQLYSVRLECAKDFPGTIARVAEMGYKGVEFAGYYDYKADEVRQMLADNGLQSCGAHTGIAEFQDDVIEKTIEYNAAVGNKNLIIPWLPVQQYTTKESWLGIAEQLNSISEKLKPHGMRIGYHNHTGEFQKIDDEYIWDILMGNTNADVITQLDVGHCYHAGVNPAEVLKKYPGRAITVHMKAWDENDPKALIGEDTVPWQEIIAACKTVAGTQWYIIEEELNLDPPFVAVEKCLANFKKMKAEA